MEILKIPVHVEAVIFPDCMTSTNEMVDIILEKLRNSCPVFKDGNVLICSDDILSKQVESIRVCDLGHGKSVSFWQAELNVHVYRLCDTEPEKDFLEGEEDLPACEQWELPNRLLLGLWDSIVVDESLKNRLLGYCDTSMSFSEAGVDSNIISWNRMVLLHGPPGTGKTTICKALAQKLFIRNTHRYSSGILLEINSHSLFSKWFSESGKLVMKLFDHVTEIAEDEQCFVCVLIDEVESMVSARSAAVKGNEPGDAVRVVNAVLTSLDALRRRPNTMVLCTSNMLTSIDSAFRDRVDLKVYMGPPPTLARYRILHSCLMELMERGIIRPSQQSLSLSLQIDTTNPDRPDSESTPSPTALELQLLQVATLSQGCSGRGLRKLPMKAHAFFLQRPVVSLEEFIWAMTATLQLEAEQVKDADDAEDNL
eukprot:gene10790-22527_t